ncbi:MAG TPA: FtsX-like permease family protein [Actinomycetota bacterium]|nr:FtsX-like permease family protein [Actinomycetota bacterium]
MYPNLTPYLVGLVGLALAGTLVISLRHGVLRRLALRQIARRRGEAALVVIGSVLGTAIIVGSLVVGDTFNSSIERQATAALGPVDEVVVAPPAQGGEVARRLAPLRSDPEVDGLLVLTGGEAAVGKGDGAGRKAEPRAGVFEVDFAQAAAFGGAADRGSGLGGPGPRSGEIVINSDLASVMDARAGDVLTVWLYGQPTDLRVVRVVPAEGVAAAGAVERRRHGFVAPGTLAEAARKARAARPAPAATPGSGGLGARDPAAERLAPQTFVFVSNTGGVKGGNSRSDAVAAKIEAALGPLAAKGKDAPADQGAADQPGAIVDKPKQEALREAEEVGNELGSLFLFIGSFAIIAGVLLLVNIFVMLAEERKPELGMLRAVGMRRGRLVRAFIIEGAVYALVASLVGVLVGLGVGRAVVIVAARIFETFSEEEGGFNLFFSFTPTSMVNGFGLGFLISFLTVALTSIRISRLNVIAAIRDLAGEGGRRLKRRWVVLSTLAAAGLGAWALLAVSQSRGVETYLLPTLTALALCPLLLRLAPRRWVYTGVSLAVLGWGLAANTVRPHVFDDGSTATFVVLGSVLVFSAVVLVSQNQELLTRPLRPLVARPSLAGLATRLGVAYPVARRFRTGAILIMYGLVVFTLVLLTVLGNVISSSVGEAVADASGGFAIRADFNPSGPVTDPSTAFTSGRFAGKVAAVAPLTAANARITGLGRLGALDAAAVGVTDAILDGGLFPLDERMAGLGDDRAAWRKVLADPRYVIADRFLGDQGAGPSSIDYHPGDTLTLTDPRGGTAERKTIAGTLRSGQAFYDLARGNGPVILSQRAVAAQFGSDAELSSALVAPAAGTSDEALAADLQGEYLPASLVTTQIRRQVELDFAANRSFFQLMEGFLALGLAVGIAGLGVVMVRAVRERRRTIGVLRALGFQSGTVQRSFLIESSFVALEGIVLGTVLSVVTSYLLFKNDPELQASGIGFPVPWTSIAVLVAATAVASLLATLWPARRAAATKPAVALRIAD